MPDQARAVSAVRTRPLRRAVLRPHQTVADLAAEERPGTFFAGVERDGELIAVGWVRPEGPPGSWRVGGMATAPEARRGGLGRMVLVALVEYARGQGASRLWCHARAGARAFYESEGWRVESEEYVIEPIGPHFTMARPVG